MAISSLWGGGKKKDEEGEGGPVADPKTVKDAKKKFADMDMAQAHIKVTKTGPIMHEGKKLAGIGQVVRTWKSAELKKSREIEEYLETSYGGGTYEVKYIDAASGEVVHSTTLPIDTAEFPPRYEEQRDPGYYGGPSFQRPPQAQEGGIDSKTIVELVMSTANTNMEALKLMMEQSRLDQANRKDDAAAQIKLVVETMKEAFVSSTKSQESTVNMMLQSKNEQIELIKMIIQDNKNAGADNLRLIIDMFSRGMEVGADAGAAPKSDLAEIMGTIATAFSNVVALKNAQPVAQPLKVLPPASKPKPVSAPKRQPVPNPVNMDDPNVHRIAETESVEPVARIPASPQGQQRKEGGAISEEAGQDSDNDEEVEFVESDPNADDLLKKIIEVVKTRPEKPGVLAYVISKTPRDMLIEFHTTGDTAPIFNWLALSGDSELVAELTELLSIEDNKQWIRGTMEAEGQALEAQSQETK